MVHFKNLKSEEIETINKMMQDFYAIDNYPINLETSIKLFEEFISNKNLGKCWLIFDDNIIVGYVILTFIFSFEYGGKIAFLDELYIQKSSRGKGIGKETISFIKEEVAKLNVKLIYLEVENHNEIAQKMYLANDFVIHNRKLLKFKV